MHFLYVDESGDTVLKGSPTRHFVLCGLLVHHNLWHEQNNAIKRMRQRLELWHGYPSHHELHASELLGRAESHLGLSKSQRIQCTYHILGLLEKQAGLTPIRVTLEKHQAAEITIIQAWATLLDIVATHLARLASEEKAANFGLCIVCDDHRTSPGKAWINAIYTSTELGNHIIDLPFGRDSADSNFLQMADLLSYLSRQQIAPGSLFRENMCKALLRKSEKLFQTRGISIVAKK